MISINQEQICEIFHDRCVVIIEDDEVLSNRISEMYQKYNHLKIIKIRNVDQARIFFTTTEEKFDFVIIDIMLPNNTDDEKEIELCFENLKKIEQQIREIKEKLSTNYEDIKKHLDLQQEREDIYKYMNEFINRKGGIEIINYVRAKNFNFPIIILSALRYDDPKEFGLSVSGKDIYWIKKPISNEQLICKTINILQGKK